MKQGTMWSFDHGSLTIVSDGREYEVQWGKGMRFLPVPAAVARGVLQSRKPERVEHFDLP